VRKHCAQVLVSFKKAISLNKRNVNIIEKVWGKMALVEFKTRCHIPPILFCTVKGHSIVETRLLLCCCVLYLLFVAIVAQFGFFCYTMQSHASQILRQPSLFVLSDVHLWARSTHREMQEQAKKCFTMALELGGARNAEPWIYRWMLGKLGRKLREPAKKVLGNLVEVRVK